MKFLKLEVWGYSGKFEAGFVNTAGLRSVLRARDEAGEACSILRWDTGQYVVAKGTPEDLALLSLSGATP